jgi:hypothetical protein
MTTWIDRSGTVASGGMSQELAAADVSRSRIIVENPPSAMESLFINFTALASTTLAGSIELTPGSSWGLSPGPVSTEQVNVTAATAGHAWFAKEWIGPIWDYCQLQERISDEIADTALPLQVQYAIQDAIKFYSRQRWPFLEGSATFSTVAAQQSYGLPQDYKSMIMVNALVSGSYWKLTPRTFEYLRGITVLTTTKSPPRDMAIWDGQIWLWPIPDRDYLITEYYDRLLPELSQCGDTNIWTQDGEELIRFKAKELLYRNVTWDFDRADAMQAEIDNRIYPEFRSGYNQYQASGKIMPTYL